jgi:hydrogenase/urease accessory protein HupE
MQGLRITAFAALLLGTAIPAIAHPVPFSYVDLRLQPQAIDASIVVHVFDVAHDLGIEKVDTLLEPAQVAAHRAGILQLVSARLQLAADGRVLNPAVWSEPELLIERQSIRLMTRYPTERLPGRVTTTASMFPYDPQHQTFVNVYENGDVTSQAILDANRRSVEYFTGTRQGTVAVVKRFIPSGVHHILIGPDHLLFLVGLLLLGGTLRRLLIVVSAFTLAHSVTLSLAALNIVTPPARIVEPAIALSIVYVGADNLMVRGGRDMRGWIAFAFGFIHGFGFANVLRDMDLPAKALGWSLFSFNLGVEIGQLVVVIVVAAAFSALRARSESAGRLLAVVGSVIVIAAGAFWFVQRVFFPGGMA